MPDFGTAVSDMDEAAALVGDELVPIIQDGDNKRTTPDALLQSATDALTAHEIDPGAHSDLLEDVVLLAGDQTVTGTKSVPAIIVKDSPTDVRHPDFGGVDPTGTVDSAPAIQAAIDYILGPADPSTTTRSATSPLFIPNGVYNVHSPITIESALGFQFHGEGKAQTYFRAKGTMDSVFDLNGVSRSTFGGFSIIGDSTESITNAVWCHRSAGIARSTNYSTLYDINVAWPLRCVRGINIGEAGENTQNDTWMMNNLEVSGGWSVGEATWWQDGIKVGTGAFNNNLDHKGYDINCDSFRYNFHIAACQLGLFGFETGQSEADFYIGEAGVFLCAQGGRSEGAGRLIYQPLTGSAPALAQFQDIDWKGNDINDDGRVVYWGYGGSLSLKNIRFYCFEIPVDGPRLFTYTDSQSLDVTLDGISASATLEDFLTDVGVDTQVHIRNGYSDIGITGAIVTHTSGSVDVAGSGATQVVSRNRLNDDDYDRYQLAIDGTMYRGDGTAAPTLVAPNLATFNVTGTVAVGAGVARLPIPFGATIVGVSATAGTAPVGADLIVDVNISGVSIFTTIANRPKILDGAHATAAEVTNMNTTAVASGSYLTVDVDQVGSGTAGADLAVTIRYRIS